MDIKRLAGWVGVMVAALCAPFARADIQGPDWNWSTYGTWGYGYTATFGQTFVGNGEACTGVRLRFYSESCCSSVPYRVMIFRWDSASRRAIGAPLAFADSTYSNISCCWFNKEVSFPAAVVLEQGVPYVVAATVTPWWSQYCCNYVTFAINPDSSYASGTMFVLSNGGSTQAWTTQQWSETGYDLNFTIYTTADCDGNGVVDAIEVANGTAPDCNANGLSDRCEQLPASAATLVGAEEGPVGASASVSYQFPETLPSGGDVQLRIEASADLSATHEFLIVTLANGVSRPIFTGTSTDCEWIAETITIPRDEFNAAILKNTLSLTVAASSTVDAASCGGLSAVRVQFDYTEAYRDCNGNLVADYLDFCSGVSLDCNGNRNPDECDIASGASADIDADAVPDECQPDCNGDARPDAFQIFSGEEPDCNGNGKPDECDIYQGGGSIDCNGNGVPDECDIASGASPDCDADGRIDACGLAAGFGRDCNGNGVPDSCDIASGASADCDEDGRPDSCELGGAGYIDFYSPQQSFTAALPYTYRYLEARPAGGDVYMEVYQYSYSAAYDPSQRGKVLLDGVQVYEWSDCHWGCCSNGNRGFWVSQSTWNSLADDGELNCQVTSASDCGGAYARLRFAYTRLPLELDCNANGIPDDCDIDSGFDHDCDANGRLDGCDIAAGAEDDNKNGYPDPCELDRGDLNLDGTVDAADLTILLVYWGAAGFPIGDLNHDGIIGAEDLTIMLDNWGETY